MIIFALLWLYNWKSPLLISHKVDEEREFWTFPNRRRPEHKSIEKAVESKTALTAFDLSTSSRIVTIIIIIIIKVTMIFTHEEMLGNMYYIYIYIVCVWVCVCLCLDGKLIILLETCDSLRIIGRFSRKKKLFWIPETSERHERGMWCKRFFMVTGKSIFDYLYKIKKIEDWFYEYFN